ncbi:MAG TPA: hypothetical protein VHB50_15275 [Bryobacteraceae bacterium]|nr:hypothetical protein [Bryobacteraceae bacterium]
MHLHAQNTAPGGAIRRGIAFLQSVALNPEYFAEDGEDLLWCFYTTSTVAADPEVRAITGSTARQLALQWSRMHPGVPPDATVDDLVNLATGAAAANALGVRTPGLRSQLRRRARTFTPRDFFAFDPRRGPPGSWDVWCDALIAAHAGNFFDVRLGASYRDIVRWLPAMRPYPAHPAGSDEFRSVVYSITHLVYTLNDYGAYSLDRNCLRPEYEYLVAHLREMIALRDSETLGEFLDSLRSFGLTSRDPLIADGVRFLLSTQNADGSWGAPDEKSIYTRYHSTWTAIDGLLEYRFRPARGCPVRRY